MRQSSYTSKVVYQLSISIPKGVHTALAFLLLCPVSNCQAFFSHHATRDGKTGTHRKSKRGPSRLHPQNRGGVHGGRRVVMGAVDSRQHWSGMRSKSRIGCGDGALAMQVTSKSMASDAGLEISALEWLVY